MQLRNEFNHVSKFQQKIYIRLTQFVLILFTIFHLFWKQVVFRLFQKQAMNYEHSRITFNSHPTFSEGKYLVLKVTLLLFLRQNNFYPNNLYTKPRYFLGDSKKKNILKKIFFGKYIFLKLKMRLLFKKNKVILRNLSEFFFHVL